MANEENKANTVNKDEEVTITLKRGELFQLNLCVVARLGTAQCKFANAFCEEEQKSTEGLINFLTALSIKLTEANKK